MQGGDESSGWARSLDRRNQGLYLTDELFNPMVQYGSLVRHFRGARRPDAARDPGAPRTRRDFGERTGGAVRHVDAGGVAASQGAGAGRADHARARSAVAPVPPQRAGAQAGRRMARALSPTLGRAL